MNEKMDALLFALAEQYQKDSGQFLNLSAEILASADLREFIAGLRNEGYVEEQRRGVIRFTTRGYRAYTREPDTVVERSKEAARHTFCPPHLP